MTPAGGLFVAHRMARPIGAPRLVALASVLTMLALLVAACGDRGRPDPAQESLEAEDPGIVHVHGLGINPRDGLLYIATHTGLFRVSALGEAERVGDRYHDLMGFTIVGPDHFLASGHPDVRDHAAGRLPTLLGLMESHDGGQTWRDVSLSASVDFHALSFAHDLIFGWDSSSQTFMVSRNGTAWERRSRVILTGFAVGPDGPDDIIAAIGRGALISRDGGSSWSQLPAPQLVVVAWGSDGVVMGVDVEGVVFASPDAGATWEGLAKLPGMPEAVLLTDEALYVSVYRDGIHASRDQGRTWQLLFRDERSTVR